ncbi:MAG: nuclear transport factor 2 family protein [Pegethrix bostrychoides GSE-TBD4-15B]|jgi:uncharacterized protein (TIGR02246 family)|uniref:Nuclear transport factor 2 family protein n=1 Tax=Pegethrix bostrychoides GSE-TBD4-15B TaxID=2839662 RepID=A0A951U739_9CYAN|nr:nuclear transport factor 2 family protein [Pegethrix bostrychoides GSE-TBD4-15B]
MAERHLSKLRLGGKLAMAGVMLAVSLALISMTILTVLLLPQILPTLLPAHGSALLAPMTSMAQAAQPNPMHQAIQTARTAWITGDADAFAALFSETGEFVVPGQIYRGREEIRAVTAAFLENHASVQIEIHRLITEGNQVAVEWHWEDTETATGQRTVADDVIVVDFAAGQITRWREYIDAT